MNTQYVIHLDDDRRTGGTEELTCSARIGDATGDRPYAIVTIGTDPNGIASAVTLYIHDAGNLLALAEACRTAADELVRFAARDRSGGAAS